jgi:hypothetical protein
MSITRKNPQERKWTQWPILHAGFRPHPLQYSRSNPVVLAYIRFHSTDFMVPVTTTVCTYRTWSRHQVVLLRRKNDNVYNTLFSEGERVEGSWIWVFAHIEYVQYDYYVHEWNMPASRHVTLLLLGYLLFDLRYSRLRIESPTSIYELRRMVMFPTVTINSYFW